MRSSCLQYCVLRTSQEPTPCQPPAKRRTVNSPLAALQHHPRVHLEDYTTRLPPTGGSISRIPNSSITNARTPPATGPTPPRPVRRQRPGRARFAPPSTDTDLPFLRLESDSEEEAPTSRSPSADTCRYRLAVPTPAAHACATRIEIPMGAALFRRRPNQSLRRRPGSRQLDPSTRGRGEEVATETDGGPVSDVFVYRVPVKKST